LSYVSRKNFRARPFLIEIDYRIHKIIIEFEVLFTFTVIYESFCLSKIGASKF